MRGPDFFIVGAPKCATTAIHSYLGEHQSIFMPERKEVHHYGQDLAHLPYALNAAEHGALFAGADDNLIIGETCIWALYSTSAAREIHDANPHAKIVVLLRNPIEMVQALHSEYLLHAIEDIADFRKDLDAQDARRTGKRLPQKGRYPASIYAYYDIAKFSIQLERYFHQFGRERVHVILQDEFKKDTCGQFQRLLKFLDVDASFSSETKIINSSKRLRSHALQRMLVTGGGLTGGWWRWLIPFDHNRLERYSAHLLRWNMREAPRPPMNPRLRRRLLAEFSPEIKRLGSLIDRDLAHWTKAPAA